MKKAAFLMVCVLGASSALAQTSVGKAGANAMSGPTPGAAEFVRKASMADLFEIRSGKLAEQKGNEQAKNVARHMIADHEKTTAQLQGLLKSGKVQAEPATALDETHQNKIDLLDRQEGADFSKGYLDAQLAIHKEAVSLFERYAKDGDDPQLKAWAGKTLPTLKQHLEMAEAAAR